jgi:drug/metabolite transporter (DMT)-like permease
MTDHTKGLLITALGVLFIVPDSLFTRLIEADMVTVAFWRNLTSGCVAALVLLAFKGRGTLGVVRATGRAGLIYGAIVALTGILFVFAVKLTSVANVVLILASMPMFAAVFSWFMLGERIGLRMVLTMLAVSGGIAVIAYGSGANEVASIEGDAIALAIAAIFAFALTVARRARAVSMMPAVPFAFLAAALMLWPFAEVWSIRPEHWWMVAVHGGVFIVVSMSLLAIGPRYIPSAEVSLLVLLESVLAPLLVWAVVGEHPGAWTLAGGAIVVGALLVSNVVALKGRSARP